jgi:hypothetical protein
VPSRALMRGLRFQLAVVNAYKQFHVQSIDEDGFGGPFEMFKLGACGFTFNIRRLILLVLGQ